MIRRLRHVRVFPATKRVSVGVALLCLIASGCQTARIPHTGIKVPVPSLSFIGLPWPGLGEGDLRKMGWEEAFVAMKGRMEREYPFTEWKGIDWAALEARFHPRIKAAQDAGDAEAYYLALREFLYSIPDGHVGISDESGHRKRAIGGGFGFAVSRLEDGRVIAHFVEPAGPAAAAGIKPGAELLAWNGRPMGEAAASVSVLWAKEPPATLEVRTREQYNLLTRAPVGASAKVSFRNEGTDALAEAALTAYDDDYRPMELLAPFEEDAHNEGTPFVSETLPSGAGYVKVLAVGSTLSVPFPERAFAKILQGYVDAGAPGLILDLRRNSGGSDALAARLCGHFFGEERLYKYVELPDEKSGLFVRHNDSTVTITPEAPHFGGPVVILIDSSTLDAAEGIAAMLKHLPNVKTVGEEATHGAFATTGGGIDLPGGHTVFYPVGRAVDDDGRILVESGRDGAGGVAPDVHVPVTRESLHRRYVDGVDVIREQGEAVLQEMIASK